jgi:hypothetical protein
VRCFHRGTEQCRVKWWAKCKHRKWARPQYRKQDKGLTNAVPETAAAMEQLANCFEERSRKFAAWLRGFGWLVSGAPDCGVGDSTSKAPGSARFAFGNRSLELAERIARQNAKLWQAARASIEPMEQLQRTLSSSEIAIGSTHEPELSSVDLLEVPIDTIYETNRGLGELIESAKQFRETANEWTSAVLQDFAGNAKQSARRNRLMIAAAFFVLGLSVIVLFYLQLEMARAQLANQAMIARMTKTNADQSAWMKRLATSYADQNAKIVGLINAYVNRNPTSNRQIVDLPHETTSIRKLDPRPNAFKQKTRTHHTIR